MAPREKQSLPKFQDDETPEAALMTKWNIFDKAAKKDLHWWFFALLMIGMGYVGFERWESAEERKALRNEITDVRTSQLEYVTKKNEALMEALMNNTRALEANTQTLNRIEARRNP